MTHHPENDPQYIGLKVNPGIEKPEAVNADSVKKVSEKRKAKDPFARRVCAWYS